jgi:hypothetical protein
VARELFNTRVRNGILGTFGIDRDRVLTPPVEPGAHE